MPEALPKLIELAAQDPRMVSDDIVKRMTEWSSSKEIRELMYNTLPQAKDPYTVSAMLRSMQDAATLHFQVKKASEAPKPRRDETDPAKIEAAKEAQKNFVPDDAENQGVARSLQHGARRRGRCISRIDAAGCGCASKSTEDCR